ncbi:hypothetical protein Tco_1378607 [Tanacetum coccineum]
MIEASRSNVDFEEIQDEDTQPSKNTKEHHIEVDHENVNPHSDIVPIRRFARMPQALKRYGFYVDAETVKRKWLFKKKTDMDGNVHTFKYYLVAKVKADEALKYSITMGIPFLEDMGFTKETDHVEYEWRPPRCEQCKIFGHVNDQCPMNATTIPNVVMNNNGFQRFDPKAYGNSQTANDGPNGVHSSSKEKPIKAANISSSSYTRGSPMKDDLQYPTSASNIPTSNPYDALDDMESDEEIEVVFDETINLLDNNIIRAKNTAPNAFKT